eukprot:CAMPEP_0194334390 /NCGR_PEP_ID=MMETSP0171-20130528/65959_1 /TAXON_ID=218684 /ORGANISM="Corethron pennatum, Strain L29A3" /LENGTH=280 /DNA_ID=CAMNT_0039097017 /DNA_START=236 /DNA_END=1075 /DNA_ORIENTATION=+
MEITWAPIQILTVIQTAKTEEKVNVYSSVKAHVSVAAASTADDLPNPDSEFAPVSDNFDYHPALSPINDDLGDDPLAQAKENIDNADPSTGKYVKDTVSINDLSPRPTPNYSSELDNKFSEPVNDPSLDQTSDPSPDPTSVDDFFTNDTTTKSVPNLDEILPAPTATRCSTQSSRPADEPAPDQVSSQKERNDKNTNCTRNTQDLPFDDASVPHSSHAAANPPSDYNNDAQDADLPPVNFTADSIFDDVAPPLFSLTPSYRPQILLDIFRSDTPASCPSD